MALALVPGAWGFARPAYRIDAASYFDPFAGEVGWLHQHVSVIKGYGSFAATHYVPTGIPTIDYHDLATEGFAPLTAASRAAYMARVEHDRAQGFAGVFNDDANFSLGYRDGSQSKASYEPEAREVAALVAQERRAWPGAIIETNTQWHDLRGLWEAGDPNVKAMLAATSLVTKEFGVGPTSAITTTADYAALQRFDDELRATGKALVFTGDYHSVTPETEEYNLATSLLNGGNYVNGSGGASTPTNLWPGFNAQIGEVVPGSVRSGPPHHCYYARGYTNALVLANPRGCAPFTFRWFSPVLHSAEWGSVLSVTLNGGQGAVLEIPNTSCLCQR